MKMSLCSSLFDSSGGHLIDVDVSKSDFSTLSRRVSRTATLDGGALIVDNGYSVSDATFSISVPDLSPVGFTGDFAAPQLTDTVVQNRLLQRRGGTRGRGARLQNQFFS